MTNQQIIEVLTNVLSRSHYLSTLMTPIQMPLLLKEYRIFYLLLLNKMVETIYGAQSYIKRVENRGLSLDNSLDLERHL